MDGQADGPTKCVGRREVVCGLAVGGLMLLSGTGAGAVTLRSGSDYGGILDGACGASADHRRQIAEVEKAFGLPLTDSRVIDALRRAQCPGCGCSLALAAGLPGSF